MKFRRVARMSSVDAPSCVVGGGVQAFASHLPDGIHSGEDVLAAPRAAPGTPRVPPHDRRPLKRLAQLGRDVVRRRLVLLTAGAISAQLVVLLVAPFLTRLYSPAQFGTYGVATAAIGIASALATMRYFAAIPLPSADAEAAALAVASLAIAVGAGLVTGAAVWLLVPLLAPAAATAAPLVGVCAAISVFALGAYQVVGALATRRADIRTLTVTRFTQSGGVAVGQLVLGFAAAPLGLVIGDSLGRLTGLFGSLSLWRRWLPLMRGAVRSLHSVVRYKMFPLAAAPAALLNVLTLQLPTLAVVALFGTSSGGQYLLVQRVAGLPLAVVSVSVAQDFLVGVIERGEHRADGLRSHTERTERRLLVIGAPLVVVAAALAPVLFPVVFGPDWSTAGLIFAISAPVYLAQFVTSPLGAVYDVLERQDLYFVREVARFAFMVAGIVLCVVTRSSLEVSTAILTAAGVAGYLVYRSLARRAMLEFELAIPR